MGRLPRYDERPDDSTGQAGKGQEVRVEETWWRLMDKCLLQVTGQEAKAARGTENIARSIEAGIEGGIHAIRMMWQHHSQEEDWGLLLIDARNVFNEENRTAVIWDVSHDWPSCMQFTFKCYSHWATLVVRNTEDGSGHFLYRNYGVTQGDLLAMITYVIGVIPLIRELRDSPPRVTQAWYADDTGARGGLRAQPGTITGSAVKGPLRSYFPELTKSILVVALRNALVIIVSLSEELLQP